MVRVHLSRLLGEKKWTQAHLSRITGIRENTINDLYHEFAERINLDHIEKICMALECELTDLIEITPNKK